MIATRTNLSINIEYENVQDVERVLYHILNELSSDNDSGQFHHHQASYNYAREKFTKKDISSSHEERIYQSKINTKQ